jgi:hypothetical protein
MNESLILLQPLSWQRNAPFPTVLDTVTHLYSLDGVVQCTALFLGEGYRFPRAQQTSLDVQTLPEGKHLSCGKKAHPGKGVNSMVAKRLAAHNLWSFQCSSKSLVSYLAQKPS